MPSNISRKRDGFLARGMPLRSSTFDAGGPEQHHAVTGAGDHDGQDTFQFGSGGGAEVRDASVLGAEDDDPVELLSLAEMAGEQVHSRNGQQRGLVADDDAGVDLSRAEAFLEQVTRPLDSLAE